MCGRGDVRRWRCGKVETSSRMRRDGVRAEKARRQAVGSVAGDEDLATKRQCAGCWVRGTAAGRRWKGERVSRRVFELWKL